MYLTKDAILSADDAQIEDVHVPQWGGTVRLRGMTGAERDAFEGALLNKKGDADPNKLINFRARLVVRCVVDGQGKRLFEDNDAPALGKKSAAAIDVLFEAARRLSGMSDDDMQEMEANLSDPAGDASS